ncbi:MAG: hypothetical protein NTX64_18125, partial [Elusimicrobia bacterium]|nr:hypothetical protein [Elusimicrobiota bacterium]
AMGQAHLQRTYREILSTYFPGSEVRGAPQEPPGPPVYKAVVMTATGGVTPAEKRRALAKKKARMRQAERDLTKRLEAEAAAKAVRASTAAVKGSAAPPPVVP